jgi:salicylate hydroxylase
VTRVAIVGGGLGGLAAAAFLHQAGVPAVVYEQARELREVGTGIMVAIAPAGDYVTESWTATATVDEFLAEFDGWDARLTSLIKAARTPGRRALLIRQPLPRWTRGPVTLLGDAAHPMLPFLGQGAAQAFEDAAVLATCLAGDQADPVQALRRYESERIARASKVQQGSYARADYNHLPDGPEQHARDEALQAADPLAANAWIYAHDPLRPH